MSKRVLVFGSYVTDLSSRISSFPKPGQTVKGTEFRLGPGGKGSNQAVAASRAGADVTFVTKLGDDLFGNQSIHFYQQEELNAENIIIEKGGQTGSALIMVDETTSQNEIVVVSGTCEQITEEDIQKTSALLDQTDIFLTQLETNIEPVYRLLHLSKSKGILTVLNPAPAQQIDPEYLQYIDILVPNETEAEFLTGIPVTDHQTARTAAQELLRQGIKSVVITLGKQGAYAIQDGQEQLITAVNCGPAVDTTGAGDAFIGGMVAALADGKGFFDAIRFGTVTAGIAVTRKGTAPAMPYEAEIRRHYMN